MEYIIQLDIWAKSVDADNRIAVEIRSRNAIIRTTIGNTKANLYNREEGLMCLAIMSEIEKKANINPITDRVFSL